MTPEQAKAVAALICAVIDYFHNPSDEKHSAIVEVLMKIKEIPA